MPRGRPLRPRPLLAIYTVQMTVKYNAVSLRHKHRPETLFILRIYSSYSMSPHLNAMRNNYSTYQIIFYPQNFIFENFILFFKNFVSFYLILFYLYFFFQNFFLMNSVHETVPKKSDSETTLSPKTGQVHSMHTHSPTDPASTPSLRTGTPRLRVVAVSWLPSRPCRSVGRAPLRAVPHPVL